MLSNSAISIKNISKRYGEKVILNNISIEVEKGKIFGLLGQNGVGKTTLIKIITNECTRDGGEVKLLGKDVVSNDEIKNMIGIVGDDLALYDRLTVLYNLDFFARFYSVPLERVEEVMQLLNLIQYKNMKVSQLSKGYKQRVNIARAILHKPNILILDEPTSGLDPISSNYIRKVVRAFADEGKTVFLTSHYMDEVDELCDEVAFLNNAVIVEKGSPIELKLKYGSRDVAVYVEGKEDEVIVSLDDRNELINLLDENKIKRIHSKEGSLQEIFMKVISGDNYEDK